MFPENVNSIDLFRKPFGNNPIIIEREERIENPKDEFKIENIKPNDNPLLVEKDELNKQLDNVCEENEKLNEEIKKLNYHLQFSIVL